VDVLGVYNTRTGESFASIQEAVDDVDTVNGDTITLADGTYTENVSIDKRLTIKPAAGATVTVKVDDSNDDVFDTESVLVINVGGSGSTIQDLNIIGSPDSYGVALSHAFNVSLINNTISGGKLGVYLYQSGNNTLTGNNINNNYYGVALYQSTSNTITGGNITQNMNGIYFIDSDNNLINGTTINDNWYGTYLYHSNGNTISGSTVEGNWVGMYLYNTNNNLITGNQFTAKHQQQPHNREPVHR
jgi:trimeric autotransporter adhesin